MRLLKFFLSLTIIASTSLLLAAKSPIMRIQGKVVSFSEKSVVLENEKQKVEVPRAFIGVKRLKVGESVEAAFHEKEQDKVKVRKAAK